MKDPRARWATAMAVAAFGFLLSLPATGWLETVGIVLGVVGALAQAVFYIEVDLRSRHSEKGWRRHFNWSWWNDLDEPRSKDRQSGANVNCGWVLLGIPPSGVLVI